MISLVSAYYQNEEMTIDFLENLKGKLPADCEVILVNAGSAPIEHEIIDRRVDLEHNESFSNSMNAGIVRAKGDYICVIGNDVFPQTDDWLDKLMAVAEETKAMITSPINDQTVLSSYKLEMHNGWHEVLEMFPAVCWLLSRQCVDTVGLFDEQYLLGTYEDDDYCKRVLNIGGRIVLAPEVVVKHLVSKTMALFNLPLAMAENRLRFNNKWRVGS